METDPIQLKACRAYAKMMNTLDFSHLEPWLDDNLNYTSQWVFDEMNGKAHYSEYMRNKLETIKTKGERVWAEIGHTHAFSAGYCVILAQGEETNLHATLLITMNESKIQKMAMCCVPSPYDCQRIGERPL